MSDLQIIAKGKYLHLVTRGTWEYVHRPGITGIVAIAAMTDDRKVVLVEQYRPPVKTKVIEMPAGLAGDIAESAGEAMADAARRELLEETGFSAKEMIQVAHGTVSAGLSDEVTTVFLAKGLKREHEGGGDENEDIITHLVPIDTIDQWFAEQEMAGKIIDLKVFSGLRFLKG